MSHSTIYSKPELYDLAFDFRDVAAECEVLVELARRYSGAEPTSFLELAAGPAHHTLEMARRGLRAVAVDLSPDMVAFGLKTAEERRLSIEYFEADMAAFALPAPVDLATILMASETYLLDNDAVVAHLDCAADALAPGGLYVLEMGHPRDAFGIGDSAISSWVTERDGTTVEFEWGRSDDTFDPISQIKQSTATVKWERGDERGEITEVAPERIMVPNELRALVSLSGRFEIVAELGALDPDLPVGNDKASWRFVPVLRRLS